LIDKIKAGNEKLKGRDNNTIKEVISASQRMKDRS
jgi:hypothetical protein